MVDDVVVVLIVDVLVVLVVDVVATLTSPHAASTASEQQATAALVHRTRRRTGMRRSCQSSALLPRRVRRTLLA